MIRGFLRGISWDPGAQIIRVLSPFFPDVFVSRIHDAGLLTGNSQEE